MVPPDSLQHHDLDGASPQFHEQQTASEPLSYRSTPFPQGTGSAQEGPQEAAAQSSEELRPRAPALQKLHHLNRSSPDFHNQFCGVLYEQEYIQCAQNVEGDDLVWLVDYLNKALDRLDPSSAASRKCLRELRSICGTRAILPASYTLSAGLLKFDANPFASGGYGDVYLGTLGGSKVCARRMRLYHDRSDDNRRLTKIFYREAITWKRLTHPNIVPLLGLTIAPLQLISSWMPGGTLREYIGKHPDSDRPGLLSDVAKGLCYLHSRDVIHGGIKGANILVDDSGHARIADFSEAILAKDEDSVGDDSGVPDHSPRWTAPEVLNKGAYNKAADIFSFAMTMIEVFTGAVPFRNYVSATVIATIIQGKRPPRPTCPTFTDNLWTLMQRCWDHDPLLRPEASEVLEILVTPVP
ncbi:kinase-like protein [Thelephora ganbajun]|uniref:Kinase-like protein n=1 Tax=Thelephora ganbajun TaxID=370292 RepID=A0ACB6ZHM5_THEGA|nr:kinase-like protein [Thelephora ganbajun]